MNRYCNGSDLPSLRFFVKSIRKCCDILGEDLNQTLLEGLALIPNDKPTELMMKCDKCFSDPCDCKELYKPYEQQKQANLEGLRYQITNTLFLMDTANIKWISPKHYWINPKKALDNTIADFIVEADENERNDLVRYLYWKTEMSPSDIGGLIDVIKERVYGIAGPLPVQMQCETCHRQFVSTIRSRNEKPSTICSSCDALKIRKEHESWMNMWTSTPMNSPVNLSQLSIFTCLENARASNEGKKPILNVNCALALINH